MNLEVGFIFCIFLVLFYNIYIISNKCNIPIQISLQLLYSKSVSTIPITRVTQFQSIGPLPQLFNIEPVITMMKVSIDLGMTSTVGKLLLPIPFHEIHAVFDSRAKGSWLMVNISSNWEVSVLKCQPGIRILASTMYYNHNSITFFQCPNVTWKSSGFIAIGTY